MRDNTIFWDPYLDNTTEVRTMTYTLINCIVNNLQYLKDRIGV